jgi:hypothetical protein
MRKFLVELRQATMLELQAALERVQQAKGAIAMLDQVIAQCDKQSDEDCEFKVGGTDGD